MFMCVFITLASFRKNYIQIILLIFCMGLFGKIIISTINIISDLTSNSNLVNRLHHYRIKITGKIKSYSDLELVYNPSFFDRTIEDESPTAAKVTDVLMKHLKPTTLIDVGCGCGIYLSQFRKRGVDVIGYDGSRFAVEKALVPKDLIKVFDLRNPLNPDKRYDICICFEVAEHMDEKYAETLVNSLTQCSDTVVFTAALPGQGGTSHVNEKPQEYWIDLFKKKNYIFESTLTSKIKNEFIENDIIWWLVQNIMIFNKHDNLPSNSV